jgi:hypothetical protein
MSTRCSFRVIICLCSVFLASCGRHETTVAAPNSVAAAALEDPYLGTWLDVKNPCRGYSIKAEGDAYVIQDEKKKKYVGTKTNGILRVSRATGSVDMLYVKSSDRLVAAGDEYARKDPQSSLPVRAIANMLGYATALEAYAVERATSECASYPRGTFEQLKTLITPVYIKSMDDDPWGHPYYYRSDGCHRYVLVSAGQDGKFPADLESEQIYSPASDKNADDLVFANGNFVRLPPGFTPRGRDCP